MKIIILFSALLLPLIYVTNNTNDGLTTEEYAYVSKGFLYQQKMGLDPVKKGIRFEEVYIPGYQNKKAGLACRVFYRTGRKEPIATQIPILDIKNEDGEKMYYCVPSPDASKEVHNLFEKDMNHLTKERAGGDLLGLMAFEIMALHRYHLGIPVNEGIGQ